mgnify:CR=1 FL=1
MFFFLLVTSGCGNRLGTNGGKALAKVGDHILYETEPLLRNTKPKTPAELYRY